jgi:hypothetical protein
MVPGETRTVTITMQNNGNMNWQPTVDGHKVALYNCNAAGTDLGSGTITSLVTNLPAGTNVAPGGSHTFTVTVTAPSTTGTYNVNWRMAWTGQYWFGTNVAGTLTVVDPVMDSVTVSATGSKLMKVGSTQTVTITMRNTGNINWQPKVDGHDVALFAYDPATNNLGTNAFGFIRANLPAGANVPHDGTATFSLPLTAPTTPGSYEFHVRMAWAGKYWFGTDMTIEMDVSPPLMDAYPMSNTLPISMNIGETKGVTVEMQNNGNINWQPFVDGHEVALFEYDPATNGLGTGAFGTKRIPLPAGSTVLPGVNHVFAFNITAPKIPGSYDLTFRMAHAGVKWFGPWVTQTVIVTQPNMNAHLVSSSVPSTMVHGSTQSVTIVMQNTGSTTWQQSLYGHNMGLYEFNPYLGSLGSGKFGITAIPIPAGVTVPTTSTRSFTFTIKAPSTPGNYLLDFKMAWAGMTWFGDEASRWVTVT